MTTPPTNPYAPPKAEGDAPVDDAEGEIRGGWVKWGYATSAALWLLACLVVREATALGFDRDAIHVLAKFADGPLVWLKVICAGLWIHAAWTDVAERFRGDVTPGGAVGRLFLPLYNVYWLFVVNARLCDALDATFIEAGDKRRGPRELAQIAAGVQLVSTVVTTALLSSTTGKMYAFIAIAASSGVWTVYAFQCDAVRRAAAGLRTRA